MINTQYKPNFAVHPGETLRDELDFLSISQVEFAERADLSPKHVSQIVNGESPITTDTALKIERVLGGTPNAEFWNNLQKHYDLTVTRLESEKALEREINLAKKYNYAELVKYGLVPETNDWNAKTANLLNYLRVNSLNSVSSIYAATAFRRSKGKFNEESLITWLRFGEIEVGKIIDLQEYNEEKLKDLLSELKKLTFLPKDYYKILQNLCAKVGVAVVYTPYFKNTKVNGAVRWFGNNPLIQLNSRGTYSDTFWFTLFHEIGHVILHGKKDKFLDFQGLEIDEKEAQANNFAADTLIPEDKYRELMSKKNLTVKEAKEFTDSIGVDFGVLAGRLANDKILTWPQASKFRRTIDLV